MAQENPIQESFTSMGDRSDQCENCPEAGSPTQSCVFKLPKMNLSLSDAGTYYCAVVLCGEILFGNGTKLDIKGRTLLSDKKSSSLLFRYRGPRCRQSPLCSSESEQQEQQV
ncbi:T-cell surface glycoprotein CD8 beta chain-like [Salvelinus sp. IW2-2015]|uniref:T-cell surface glycoprotein CD8 beta chain-like n=1 Tax=Salvelinus sp. IW2-2015 TaxID=2691554 RepID=UPI000CDFC336|nr:T-cell surface glycoprotein CD8 beta chain-like [Salvelinus alpinus]